MKQHFLRALTLATLVLTGASPEANATVDMTFTWDGTLYQAGYTADNYAPGSPTHLINGNDAIGIYKFTTSATDGVPNPLYSVCLSPAGLLDSSTHTYVVQSFAAANPGIFPSGWASGVVGGQTQLWGVQNAAYLWSTFGMNIVNGAGGQTGNANARAAALEFAIWTALYDSTGYGTLGATKWTAPTSQMDPGTTLAYYNADLDALTHAASIPIYDGNILKGSGAPADGANAGDDQEFFLLSTPVPEATTMIAGALLLLPFAFGSFRILRKNRAA